MSPSTSKGQRRREEIIETAATLLREAGPGAVTHRAVAKRAGCSLSAMTYYFSGLDELLTEAARINVGRWAERAEKVAEYAETHRIADSTEERVALILQATLPATDPLLGHYLQLVAAGESLPVAVAYHTGRGRLNSAVQRVLLSIGSDLDPELVMAVVDGAAVSGLSEGVDVHETAKRFLIELL